MFCAIWYRLYNLKNVENTHGGVLSLVQLQTFSNTPPWAFSPLLNCTKGTKSRNVSQIISGEWKLINSLKKADSIILEKWVIFAKWFILDVYLGNKHAYGIDRFLAT